MYFQGVLVEKVEGCEMIFQDEYDLYENEILRSFADDKDAYRELEICTLYTRPRHLI